jgi:hypothetical protein
VLVKTAVSQYLLGDSGYCMQDEGTRSFSQESCRSHPPFDQTLRSSSLHQCTRNKGIDCIPLWRSGRSTGMESNSKANSLFKLFL